MVFDIVDLVRLSQAACCVFELVEMEWLRLVKFVAVSRSNDVCMLILLSSPAGAIPKLAVAFITCHQIVRLHLDLQKRSGVKLLRRLPCPKVRLVVNFWILVAEPKS